MALEDAVKRSGEKLLRRIREQSEPEIGGFVDELLSAAARERAEALDDVRRHADADREQAVREEVAGVRAEARRERNETSVVGVVPVSGIERLSIQQCDSLG